MQVDENRQVLIALQVGDAAESVTVRGDAAQVETRSGTLKEVIDYFRRLSASHSVGVEVSVLGCAGRVLHYGDDDVFDFFGDGGDFGFVEGLHHGGGEHGGEVVVALSAIHGDAAGEGGGKGAVGFEDLLRLLGVANFENFAFNGEFDTFGVESLLEVVDGEDAEFIASGGGFQLRLNLVHGTGGG